MPIIFINTKLCLSSMVTGLFICIILLLSLSFILTSMLMISSLNSAIALISNDTNDENSSNTSDDGDKMAPDPMIKDGKFSPYLTISYGSNFTTNSTTPEINPNSNHTPFIIDGTLRVPFTGLTRYLITPDISKFFGLNETTYAMLVTDVSAGSPAEKVGIRGGNMTRSISGEIIRIGGDVILSIDGNTSFIRSNEAFLNYLQKDKRVGDNITLTLLRDGLINEVQLTIESLPTYFWYDNPDEGIRIKYPSDWRVSEEHLSKEDIVKFFSPETVILNGSATDTSTAGVFVKISPSNDVRLDTIASEMEQDSEITRNLKMSPSMLSDLNAYEVVFYEYSGDRTLKVLSIFTIRDGQLYRINFAADMPKYQEYLPLAREMINSFEFTN